MHILIRYGEIGLKSSQVKTGFLKRLMQNLQHKLDAQDIDGNIQRTEDRIFAVIDEEDVSDAVISLSQVPGVVSLSPVVKTSLNLDEILETGIDVFTQELDSREDDVQTFAISARRAGEHDYTSKDIENDLGQRIVDEHGLNVDLDNPDVTLYVEARFKHAYLYTHVVDGLGGLPIDERNRVIVLMEDRASTVAAYRLMKRGCSVYPVYAGQEADALDQDMQILRQFDPDVKLTVFKDADIEDALEQTIDLFDAEAVALGVTADDLDEHEPPDLSTEILLPVCGLSQDEAMETYADINYLPV